MKDYLLHTLSPGNFVPSNREPWTGKFVIQADLAFRVVGSVPERVAYEKAQSSEPAGSNRSIAAIACSGVMLKPLKRTTPSGSMRIVHGVPPVR